MVGIISYGFYLPRYRIKTSDIAEVWGKNGAEIVGSLGISEKTVSGVDEDSVTMGYESSSMAIRSGNVSPRDIGVLFFGSETPAYAVNPSSTILGEFLGLQGNYLASDFQFACKAGTGAMIAAAGLISSGFSRLALVTASDKATGKPHDALEYTASSGSASFILGKSDPILEIVDMDSVSSDTPDFWRREGIRHPSHGGRFTGKPSYFHHISRVSKKILKKNRLLPRSFAQAVFHMPNGKFPRQVASGLGFTREQVRQSLVIDYLGNTYTASALLGLVSVLETARPGNLLFFVSYGSGAGSDAFIFRVTKNITDKRLAFHEKVKNKQYINYATYLRYMNMI
jgi:hydroxymethylglutaryl-CoA synthase